MTDQNYRVLPANLCFCKVLEIPPVSHKELDNIIRYKLSSFYPGNVDDLKIDFISNKFSAIVFYLPETRLHVFQESKQKMKLFSSYHLLTGVKDKNGLYVIPIKNRLDVHVYKNNELLELRSFEDNSEIRKDLREKNAYFVNEKEWSIKKKNPLFTKKRNSNYLLQSLILLTILVVIPQFAYYRQVQTEKQYLDLLKSSVDVMTIKSTQVSSTEEELNLLLEEYSLLLENKPLNLYAFLSDLSASLGTDVKMESLVLKNYSFQMNGRGFNPLGKMENFQNNSLFQSVIPYQVQSIDGSEKEKFSLTGMYGHE